MSKRMKQDRVSSGVAYLWCKTSFAAPTWARRGDRLTVDASLCPFTDLLGRLASPLCLGLRLSVEGDLSPFFPPPPLPAFLTIAMGAH